MHKSLWFLLLLSIGIFACREEVPSDNSAVAESDNSTVALPDLSVEDQQAPNERWGELFVAVQTGGVFEDSKTFVDCRPKAATETIMTAYAEKKEQADFVLKDFVTEYFDLPPVFTPDFSGEVERTVEQHINALWPVLTRQPDVEDNGSLIELPYAYIVPGGRFREVYYWDSYFTLLGLQAAGRTADIENMVNNFAYLIRQIGFIPNGNRTYYLTRSQPPFFSLMVQILAEEKGDRILLDYLDALEKEYQFWMNGADRVDVGMEAIEHCVRLKNGAILNRYFDQGDYPRAESYREDVETAEASGQDLQTVYRHLRSGAESGWDYSSRWFADGQNLRTIRTTDIIPVDLNALLYNLENVLSRANSMAGRQEESNRYAQRAQNRKEAFHTFCWNEEKGFFMDYDFVNDRHTDVPSLAGVYPLFFALATPEQGQQVGSLIKSKFMQPGGVVTTLNNTGQQWDYPNGWAPLQWLTIKGLRNYNNAALADTIAQRWVALNTRVYQNTGKLTEKYNVVDMTLDAGGGEYPNQDGFGWTNGVLLRLLSEE